MFKYKTKNGQDTVIPGVGQTVNGVIVSSFAIENPNLVLVEEVEQQPTAVIGTEAAQPNIVTEAVKVAPEASAVQATPQTTNQEQN